jgi:hypothetical protein
MGAFVAWFTAVILSLSLVVVLNQLGLDVSPAIGSVMHGLARFLNQPL